MYGLRHCEPHGHWATGRMRRRRFGGHGFGGGRHGMGDGDTMRAGRMLAHGDLRLIALALIAEQPRHGYEIIKLLEEKTSDWYSPSPGIVYPTLTYLEDVGYVTVQTEGSKKLYSITDEGRAHLEQNRDLVDSVLDRLAAIGERVARMRRMQGNDREDERGSRLPPLVDAALDNLRDVAAKRLEGDADAEPRVVEILARAATDLKRN
jgi:DNA-binding PadR family transcriptional regulator